MSAPLVITAYGTPVPQGSHKAFVVGRKGGPQRAIVTDDSKRTKPWKAVLTEAAREACDKRTDPLFLGPVEVHVTFWMPRPAGHFGTGRNIGQVKESSPMFPLVKPDLDKLVRALLDALGDAGCVWRDDAQVVSVDARKRYVVPGVAAGAAVQVEAVA